MCLFSRCSAMQYKMGTTKREFGIINGAATGSTISSHILLGFFCLWKLFKIIILIALTFSLLDLIDCYWIFIFRSSNILRKVHEPTENEENISIVTILVEWYMTVDRLTNFSPDSVSSEPKSDFRSLNPHLLSSVVIWQKWLIFSRCG